MSTLIAHATLTPEESERFVGDIAALPIAHSVIVYLTKRGVEVHLKDGASALALYRFYNSIRYGVLKQLGWDKKIVLR